MTASTARRRRRENPDNAVQNIAASYSRYSSDLQDESSLDRQKRKCRDNAIQNSHNIPAELEFCDSAVSGTKRERDGLNAMLAAAK